MKNLIEVNQVEIKVNMTENRTLAENPYEWTSTSTSTSTSTRDSIDDGSIFCLQVHIVRSPIYR